MATAKKYDPALTAKARTGTYIGRCNDQGTIVFRGIPYAEFNGRWKRVCELGDNDGIFQAYENGPACPQVTYKDWYKSARYVVKDEKKCFSLCVATSELTGKKPVLVFIHGGANITGGYFDPRYDLQHFVNRNPDIVFVIFNYRLGALGTLYLGGITDNPEYRYSGNLTLLDQLAALKWVQENIVAFGGDPDNVTIAGRSSGSASVTKHMTIPESWKYWKRAFAQSGTTFHSRPKPVKEADDAARNYMKAVGAGSLEELLIMQVDDLLTVSPLDFHLSFTADGITLPLDLNATILKGDPEEVASNKDILISCANGDMDMMSQDPSSLENTRKNACRDIMIMLKNMTDLELPHYVEAYLKKAKDKEDAVRFLKDITENEVDRLIQMYLDKHPDADPFFVISDCLNDFSMEYPLMLECNGLSRHNNVFHYIWVWAPENIYPKRGYHGIDAPFMLNTQSEDELISGSFGTVESDHMFTVSQEILCNFIRTGRPDYGELKAIPYDEKNKATLIIGYNPCYINDPRSADYDNLFKVYQAHLKKGVS